MLTPLVAANFKFLLDYANKQYDTSRGLHLNSKDWKFYISAGNPKYYDFVLNGTMQFITRSEHSGKEYKQYLKLADYKKIESAVLILMLAEFSNPDIIKFIVTALKCGETKLYCNCPAFLYWGSYYNLTKINSAYGKGESRFPKKRDPHQKNLVCKHIWIILNNYDRILNQLATNLLPYYTRMFGLSSPTGKSRLIKQLGEKGISKLIKSAVENLGKMKDKEALNLFNNITAGKLNILGELK